MATERVKPITPLLEEEYSAEAGQLVFPAIEEMLIILPLAFHELRYHLDGIRFFHPPQVDMISRHIDIFRLETLTRCFELLDRDAGKIGSLLI